MSSTGVADFAQIRRYMNKERKKLRSKWHICFITFLKLFVKKPKFVYLGERVEDGSIILSNHVGMSGPVRWEMYFDQPNRIWGTYEMDSDLKTVYNYMSDVFLQQKHHWKKFWAKLASIFAGPFMYLYYRGYNIIPTYKDIGFRKTLAESYKTIENGANVIIFPEDSSEGYNDEIERFISGFVVFAEYCLKKGKDVKIYACAFNKKKNTLTIDNPVKYSALKEEYADRDEIAKALCDRTNEIFKM